VSFDDLFEDVYPGLHRYCVRLTGDEDVAADTAQEAFVRLLERGVKGEPAGLKAWLFKVATHVIRDRVRVEGNRARLLAANPTPDAVEDHTAERIDRSRRVADVRRALDSLDERDRTLLLMREEGFQYRELAEAVGVEPTSVGTLLARARRRFAEAVGPSGNQAAGDS
jgi:RNA polymerase sigma-70 factor (ECF subfamily)